MEGSLPEALPPPLRPSSATVRGIIIRISKYSSFVVLDVAAAVNNGLLPEALHDAAAASPLPLPPHPSTSSLR